METPKLENRHINLFALSQGMNMMAQTVPLTYLTLFLTDYLKISPLAIGTGLLIAKTCDFLISLVAGIVIEKSNMKRGKYLSWVRLLTFTLFFGNIVQMLDTTAFISSPNLRLAVVCVFYVMFHGSMNFSASARGALITKLAGADMENRKRLTARQTQVGAATSIITSAVTLPAINLVKSMTGSDSLGFFVVTLVFSVCFLITNLIFAHSVQAFDPPTTEGAPRKKTASVKEMVQSVVTNKQMLVLFFGFTVNTVGGQVFTGLTAYFFRATDNFNFMTVAFTARSIVALLCSMAGPALGRKLGKKKSLLIAWGIYAAVMVGIRFFAVDAAGNANLFFITVMLCLSTGGMYLYTVFMTTYYLDCGEYGYYVTGVDNRTMAVTVMNWPTKIGFALGGSLVGYAVALSGYHAPTETAAAFVDDMGRFLTIWALIPACTTALAMLIIGFGYKLTEEQAAEYAKANMEREQAANA